MSMWEIESLVEGSIRLLDQRLPSDDERPRDWIGVLYRFQDWYDCSLTQFRVMDVLLRRRYTYRFPLDQHPDHAERSEYLGSLTEFTPLRQYDEDADDFSGWLEDGYIEPPWLYCDAGTDLWRRMVEAGHLRGRDADAPRPAPLIDVVATVAALAETEGDRETIAMWYNAGPDILLDGQLARPITVDDLRSVPSVRQLRQIVERTDALAVKLSHDHGPAPDAELDEVDSWWWRQIASRPPAPADHDEDDED
jgi:hypothetical protein